MNPISFTLTIDEGLLWRAFGEVNPQIHDSPSEAARMVTRLIVEKHSGLIRDDLASSTEVQDELIRQAITKISESYENLRQIRKDFRAGRNPAERTS